MGYTHYWRNESGITIEQWQRIASDARRVIELARPIIQREYNDYGPPAVDDEVIIFNGIGADGHETFWFTKGSHSFAFCKTALKPYDRVVCAVLAIAKKHAPRLSVSTDGDWGDWQEGLALCREAGIDFTEQELEALKAFA